VLHTLRRQHRIAIWMVTHQLHALLGRVDRTLELEEGRLRPGSDTPWS